MGILCQEVNRRTIRCTRTAAPRFAAGRLGSSDAGFAASARFRRRSVSSDVSRYNTVPRFSQTGGLLVDGFNASYPMARLSGDSDGLRLSCLGRAYCFPRSRIQRLSRYQGSFSVGLRIEHTQEALPEFIVFWASLFVWTSGFEKLRTRLQHLGYEVIG